MVQVQFVVFEECSCQEVGKLDASEKFSCTYLFQIFAQEYWSREFTC